MSDITIISDPGEIRLDRHGVIEAHAGTGKTHTIIRTVLRLLHNSVRDDQGRERYVHLRELLLVTYTEKAAGELKQRIRKGIEDALATTRLPALKRHLESCLNNQHEALIGTIHAVCFRLLQTWPFETGVPFETGIVDDSEGIEAALRESMRTDWQNPDTGLPQALELLARTGTSLDEDHLTLVRSTAIHLLDNEHTTLDRSAMNGKTLPEIELELGRLAEARKNLEPGVIAALDELIHALEDAAGSGKLAPGRLPMLAGRLSELRQMRDSGWYVLATLRDPLAVGRSKICTKQDGKKIPQYAAVERCAVAVAAHPFTALLREESALHAPLLLAVIANAAEQLARRWQRAKQEKGLVSYADMLLQMLRAVRHDGAFLPSLRSRLRFGIIDEFQDTSPAQWEIFRHIFLLGNNDDGPRLFIVGDPKQSIFAFQGADVRSYLRAKAAILENGGALYALETNFRSLPAMVEGANAVLGRDENAAPPDPDWFLPIGEDGISYPAAGPGSGLAKAALRVDPALRLPHPALQVVALEGSAPTRLRHLASHAAKVIQTLRGTTLSLPDGTGWKETTLDYEHFAVIVEAHNHAIPFLERFATDGIPAVKYKMEGVFQSPMARDLRALLQAILHGAGDPSRKLAALLTRFFNRCPSDIDPARDIDYCENGVRCSGDELCIAHALLEWTALADRRQWARLFRSIELRTAVRQRLIRLVDGERHLADLRQIVDYCVETLLRENGTIERLVEHLGMLYDGTASAGRDRNLHTLSSDRSSVKVLTMHAAKGLEFPVVFAVTGGSRVPRSGAGAHTWTGPDGKRRVMPVLGNSKTDRDTCQERMNAALEIQRQEEQERRRLLYVALTRAQAMLFIPAHFSSIIATDTGIRWRDCTLPARNPDNDLTIRLATLLDRSDPGIAVFDPRLWQPHRHDGPFATAASAPFTPPETPDIKALDLPSRICIETSYSALSRKASMDRSLDRSDEAQDPPLASGPQTALPGGRKTGDALHLAIEELLRLDAPARAIADTTYMESLVRGHLERNHVIGPAAPGAARDAPGPAVTAAVSGITASLTSAIMLPGGGSAVVAELPGADRSPEMEFTLFAAPHWVHGFMDLVFRVRGGNAAHPWRYFVLDWKSDLLERYDDATVAACIQDRHYDLQAKLYCHALDRSLSGILGAAYAPDQHLGGALYVFLRSAPSPAGPVAVWRRDADPENDQVFVASQIERLIPFSITAVMQ